MIATIISMSFTFVVPTRYKIILDTKTICDTILHMFAIQKIFFFIKFVAQQVETASMLKFEKYSLTVLF